MHFKTESGVATWIIKSEEKLELKKKSKNEVENLPQSIPSQRLRVSTDSDPRENDVFLLFKTFKIVFDSIDSMKITSNTFFNE